jgi:hypothetical protein
VSATPPPDGHDDTPVPPEALAELAHLDQAEQQSLAEVRGVLMSSAIPAFLAYLAVLSVRRRRRRLMATFALIDVTATDITPAAGDDPGLAAAEDRMRVLGRILGTEWRILHTAPAYSAVVVHNGVVVASIADARTVDPAAVAAELTA